MGQLGWDGLTGPHPSVHCQGWSQSHLSHRHRGETRMRRLTPQQMLELYNQKTAADSMVPK